MSTVILGGGIIGLSTAYYLSQSRPTSTQAAIHILDSSSTLLTSASGYAGGFVALDWFSAPVAPLGALSFALHRDLAEQHDGRRKWGYGASTAYSMSVEQVGVGSGEKGGDWLLDGTSRSTVAKGTGNEEEEEMLNADGTPAWVASQQGGSLEVIGRVGGCANIEPRQLCEFLVGECEKRGVKVHLSTRATGLAKGEDGVVKGVKIERVGGEGGSEVEVLEAKDIVITAGAWTPRVFKTLFPDSSISVPIDSLAGHSVVVRSPRYTTPIVAPDKHNDNGKYHAVFCGQGPHWDFAPEAMTRIPNAGKPEIWVGGLNSSTMRLPELASDAKEMIDQKSMQKLKAATVQLTGLSQEGDEIYQDDLEVVREGLCFRPASKSGKPIITKLKDEELGTDVKFDDGGVYIAAGHGPWGISLGLGTGVVVSEMVQGKKTTVEVDALGLSG